MAAVAADLALQYLASMPPDPFIAREARSLPPGSGSTFWLGSGYFIRTRLGQKQEAPPRRGQYSGNHQSTSPTCRTNPAILGRGLIFFCQERPRSTSRRSAP